MAEQKEISSEAYRSMIDSLLSLSALAPKEALSPDWKGASATGWSTIADEKSEPGKGIKVEKLSKHNGSNVNVLRFTYKMPATVKPERTADLMHDFELRKKWDVNISNARVVSKYSNGILIHTATKPAVGGAISPRDFCSYAIEISLPNGAHASIAQECVSDLIPVSKNHVRGSVGHYSLVFVPDADGGYQVEYLVQADVKGWLPYSLVQNGTIGSVVDFLRYVAEFDFDTLTNN